MSRKRDEAVSVDVWQRGLWGPEVSMDFDLAVVQIVQGHTHLP